MKAANGAASQWVDRPALMIRSELRSYAHGDFKMVIRKGKPFGRLLSRFRVMNGVKYQLHATKGWRNV